MDVNNGNEDFQKFLSLDSGKQDRIINAAIKEFTAGYKNASTDKIVREAGISKGLLFHYFGTKERLYDFIVNYAIDIVQHEYIDLFNAAQPDVLESIWQLSLLKGELSSRYPTIFDFAANAYVDSSAPKCGISFSRIMEAQSNIMVQIYANTDYSLFRDDIDPKKTIDIIFWTMGGYANSIAATQPGGNFGSNARENYDKYLEEFQDILDTLRRCFYKQNKRKENELYELHS